MTGASDLPHHEPPPPPLREEIRRLRIPASWISPFELLVGLILLAGLGIPLWFASPFIVPVRVFEGPLLQNVQPNRLSIVWYTTRPTEAAVAIQAGARRVVPATTVGTRHVAVIEGLEPGQSYAYELLHGGKPAPDLKGLLAHTAPPRGAGKLRFVVFGDSGRAYPQQYHLVSRIEEVQPELIVHTGDLVYGSGEREYYDDRFFAPYRRLIQQIPFWPSLGNHDIRSDGGSPYREVFELPENGPTGQIPENNYWFDAGPARFVIVDSNLPEEALAADVAPWLRDVFADADAAGIRWRFAVWHHPPYSVGRYKPSTHIQRALGAAVEAAHVDIVFNGHDHIYERTHPMHDGALFETGTASAPTSSSTTAPATSSSPAVDAATGTVYLVSGAGGAKLYELRAERPDYVAAANDAQYSFTVIELDADKLTGRQIGLDGTLIDQFSWTKASRAVE